MGGRLGERMAKRIYGFKFLAEFYRNEMTSSLVDTIGQSIVVHFLWNDMVKRLTDASVD